MCAGREKYGEVTGEDGGRPVKVVWVSRIAIRAFMEESFPTAIVLDADRYQSGAERRCDFGGVRGVD